MTKIYNEHTLAAYVAFCFWVLSDWTDKEIADRSTISKSTVNRLRRGAFKRPGILTIAALGKVAGADLVYEKGKTLIRVAKAS